MNELQFLELILKRIDARVEYLQIEIVPEFHIYFKIIDNFVDTEIRLRLNKNWTYFLNLHKRFIDDNSEFSLKLIKVWLNDAKIEEMQCVR